MPMVDTGKDVKGIVCKSLQSLNQFIFSSLHFVYFGRFLLSEHYET